MKISESGFILVCTNPDYPVKMAVHFYESANDGPDIHVLSPVQAISIHEKNIMLKTFVTAAAAATYAIQLDQASKRESASSHFGPGEDLANFQSLQPTPYTLTMTIEGA